MLSLFLFLVATGHPALVAQAAESHSAPIARKNGNLSIVHDAPFFRAEGKKRGRKSQRRLVQRLNKPRNLGGYEKMPPQPPPPELLAAVKKSVSEAKKKKASRTEEE